MTTFDKTAATDLLNTVFARWVQDLDLSVESVSAEASVLRMKFSDRL